tara:strand:- start:349 stop:525 length:177 start_codon:yes stop_codon:yes gene_type:complete
MLDNTEELIKLYVSQLVSQEKEAYTIAVDHLGSSFDIVKSNGFLKWKERTLIKMATNA